MDFINRTSELVHLNKEFKENTAKFIVLYGKRRIGKTRLIEEFIKNKNAVYYLAAQEHDQQQIKEFSEIINKKLGDEFLSEANFTTWKQLFSYLKKVWPKEKKIILAIDEITYIIKSNPSFPSYLQKFWDTFLSKTKTFLIITGSLVNLMIREVLSYGSPLYGRRTSQIQLESLSFRESRLFLNKNNLEEQIKFYSITGGVPKYLLLVSPGEKFSEFVSQKCFSKESFFYMEGLLLISQEFKEPTTYLNILKAIAFGCTKMNEITNFTGLESKKISSYIDILINLGLVKREIPVTKNKKFRGAIYLLEDNFLRFWYKFIFPGRSKIELRKGKELFREKKNEINFFVSLIFEKICREFVMQYTNFDKVGRWWGHYRDQDKKRKELEIDICALNEKKKEILFAECKWQENVNVEEVLTKLKEKAQFVNWNKSSRREKYYLFAKSFTNVIDKKNLTLVDLKKMEKKF